MVCVLHLFLIVTMPFPKVSMLPLLTLVNMGVNNMAKQVPFFDETQQSEVSDQQDILFLLSFYIEDADNVVQDSLFILVPLHNLLLFIGPFILQCSVKEPEMCKCGVNENLVISLVYCMIMVKDISVFKLIIHV